MLENKHILQYDLCFIIDIYVWNCLEGLRGDDHMVVGFSPITTKVVSSNPVLGEVYQIQMLNRSPLWSFLFYFFLRTIGLRFYSIKNFRNCAKKILRRFFSNFCHEIGCENDQTYIFRFVRYLSTFFYTNLPINIHFQFIIITNISFVTNPVYFVRHLASPVVSF